MGGRGRGGGVRRCSPPRLRARLHARPADRAAGSSRRERHFCSDLKLQFLCLFISPAAVAGCQARRPCLLKTHFSCSARSSSLLAALRCSVKIKRCKVCSELPEWGWASDGVAVERWRWSSVRITRHARARCGLPGCLRRPPGSRRGGVTALDLRPNHFLPFGASAPCRRPSGSWVWLRDGGQRGRAETRRRWRRTAADPISRAELEPG